MEEKSENGVAEGEMGEIKEVQTIRKKMENNNFLHFIGEVMESDKLCRENADRKWREKIKDILMDDYELEVYEFINNFKYTGGDGRRFGTHEDHEKDRKANRHLTYWNMTRGDELHPPHKEYCICETKIIENCYAVDKRDREKLVCLGNCCILRFLGDKAGRTCERCEKPHKNRKDNFCKECRKKNKEDEEKRKMEKEMEEREQRRKERRLPSFLIKKEQEPKEKERVWTYEEIHDILIKIYENSKIRCCAEKYEDEEKINDDFKICGNNDCEKLIKKKYKYCYSCYIK